MHRPPGSLLTQGTSPLGQTQHGMCLFPGSQCRAHCWSLRQVPGRKLPGSVPYWAQPVPEPPKEMTFGSFLHTPAMLSFSLLLKNIWLAWHLSWVKIACHLVSGHHATVADGDQRCQPRGCQTVPNACAKDRICSWRGHRAESQDPRGRTRK